MNFKCPITCCIIILLYTNAMTFMHFICPNYLLEPLCADFWNSVSVDTCQGVAASAWWMGFLCSRGLSGLRSLAVCASVKVEQRAVEPSPARPEVWKHHISLSHRIHSLLDWCEISQVLAPSEWQHHILIHSFILYFFLPFNSFGVFNILLHLFDQNYGKKVKMLIFWNIITI